VELLLARGRGRLDARNSPGVDKARTSAFGRGIAKFCICCRRSSFWTIKPGVMILRANDGDGPRVRWHIVTAFFERYA